MKEGKPWSNRKLLPRFDLVVTNSNPGNSLSACRGKVVYIWPIRFYLVER
jgi:hypothetical protein